MKTTVKNLSVGVRALMRKIGRFVEIRAVQERQRHLNRIPSSLST